MLRSTLASAASSLNVRGVYTKSHARDLISLWAEILDGKVPEGSNASVQRARRLLAGKSIYTRGEFPQQVHTSFMHCYKALSSQDEKAWFCHLLAQELGMQREALDDAVQRWLVIQRTHGDGSDAHAILRVATNLSAAAQPLYVRLLHSIAQEKEGIKFLVGLRADILRSLSVQPARSAPLRALAEHLRQALANWFTPGLLTCERISWKSSAELLEKVLKYEAVHPIKDWTDLQRRLSSDRRVYSFFHACLGEEPLIILHCALVVGPPSQNLKELLDPPPQQPNTQGWLAMEPRNTWQGDAHCSCSAVPTTAMFYSISAAQQGLASIDLGHFLIKRVADLIQQEFPTIRAFATLSPLPNFRQWLLARLAAEDLEFKNRLEGKVNTPPSKPDSPPLITEKEASLLLSAAASLTQQQKQASGMNDPTVCLFSPASILASLLRDEEHVLWAHHTHLHGLLKPLLMRNAARYLLLEKRRNLALDPVANFHLRNGAQVLSINWQSDMSAQGVHRSFGLCVNYEYVLDKVYENNHAYLIDHKVIVSKEVSNLLALD